MGEMCEFKKIKLQNDTVLKKNLYHDLSYNFIQKLKSMRTIGHYS